jgi:N-glycosylation protein
VSRSVQIWVTSNLWWEPGGAVGVGVAGNRTVAGRIWGYWRRWRRGRWGGRRWDWKGVGIKCVLPVGLAYFVMGWAEALRREWSDC